MVIAWRKLGGKSEHPWFLAKKKIVGNTHPANCKIGKRDSGTETILVDAQASTKGEKRMEVLVLDQSHYAPLAAM